MATTAAQVGAPSAPRDASPGPMSSRARWPRRRASKRLPKALSSPTSTTASTRARNDQQFFIKDAAILTSESVAQAAVNGQQMGESINAARVLINEPGNVLTPRVLPTRPRRWPSVAGRHRRDPRREADRRARHGPAARRRARQRRAAAAAGPARTRRRARRTDRSSAWSARASRSTPAASRSSRPTAWTG